MKLTDEQIESMFEKWESSCDSYELRKHYDGLVIKRFELNRNNHTHINQEDAFIAASAEAWGNIAFKAAISLLLPIIEKQNKALIEASNVFVYHYYHNDVDTPLSRIEADIAQVIR